jgi:hypothetical protein
MADPPYLTEFKMIATPDTGFAAIERVMADLGLVIGPDDAVTPPAIAGEREFAYWTAADGDAQVHYSFNPVVFLRVLAFSGRSAIRWKALVADRVPQLQPDGIRALLRSQSTRDVLLGLFAAAELNAVGLIGDVEPLRIDRDRRISLAAARVAEKLGLALVSIGAERLAEERRRHPDRSALFPRLGDASARREILVWLLHDGHALNDEVIKVLRSGLADPDWQVRVTAMLVATRLKATSLWPDIRRMELPRTSRSGLDRRMQSLLRATRQAALAELAGEPHVAGPSDHARLMTHLRHVLAGEEGGVRDEAREWIEGWLRAPPAGAREAH